MQTTSEKIIKSVLELGSKITVDGITEKLFAWIGNVYNDILVVGFVY